MGNKDTDGHTSQFILQAGDRCQYLPVTPCNHIIVFPQMRVKASAAVLISIWQIYKLTPALVTQNIQRAIAEQAIKIVRVSALMAWKVFTFFM